MRAMGERIENQRQIAVQSETDIAINYIVKPRLPLLLKAFHCLRGTSPLSLYPLSVPVVSPLYTWVSVSALPSAKRQVRN